MTLSRPASSFEPAETLLMETVVASAFLESVRVKLYDALETPKSLSQIAGALGTSESATATFLDALATRGFIEKSESLYSNSLMASEYLASGSPFYQGDAIRFLQGSYAYVAQEMPSLLQTPKGRQTWSGGQWAKTDTLNGLAQHALQGSLQDVVDFIASLPEFPSMRMMADIGGSHGRYTIELLNQNRKMTAEICDLPHMVPAIETLCREAGYDSRITVRGFDLKNDALPQSNYDLALVSHVLHLFVADLPAVVSTIADSIRPGGWFVAQHLDPEGGPSPMHKNVREMVTRLMGYRTHYLTANDLSALRRTLDAKGFTDFSATPTGPQKMSLLLAAKKG